MHGKSLNLLLVWALCCGLYKEYYMIKYIITIDCPLKCSYCITKNLKIKKPKVDYTFLTTFRNICYHYGSIEKDIMYTGGEPTIDKEYLFLVKSIAEFYFKNQYIVTANEEVLNDKDYNKFDTVMFSLHGRIPKEVKLDIPVYCGCMEHEYNDYLPFILKQKGYKGLTISENQRGNIKFNKKLPKIKNFTYKINRIGKCMNDNIILPDLNIINNFKNYL